MGIEPKNPNKNTKSRSKQFWAKQKSGTDGYPDFVIDPDFMR